MKIIAKTDIGLVRQTNEDNYVVIQKDENNFIVKRITYNDEQNQKRRKYSSYYAHCKR